MKLTIEHLKGYLGTDLECHVMGLVTDESMYTDSPVPITTKLDGLLTDTNRSEYAQCVHSVYTDNVFIETDLFPLLYPLSSLTDYREDLDFIPIEELRKRYSGFYFEVNPELLIKSKNTSMYISLNWANEFKSLLEKWHIDLFSLIENNLAIDKRTI